MFREISHNEKNLALVKANKEEKWKQIKPEGEMSEKELRNAVFAEFNKVGWNLPVDEE